MPSVAAVYLLAFAIAGVIALRRRPWHGKKRKCLLFVVYCTCVVTQDGDAMTYFPEFAMCLPVLVLA